MTVTRFAPGSTGHLHVGGLANALLNWRKARMAGGRFYLRFDGGNMSPSNRELRDGIRRDLEQFGLDWDGVWTYAEHREELRQRFRHWVEIPQAYACFCTPADIAERWRRGASVERVDRPEKYPPAAFAVQAVVGIAPDGTEVRPHFSQSRTVAKGTFMHGSGPGTPPANFDGSWATTHVRTPGTDGAWRPWSMGYQGPYDAPELRCGWVPAQPVRQVQITFPTGLPAVRVQMEGTGLHGEGAHHEYRSPVLPREMAPYAIPENWQDDAHTLRLPVPERLGPLRILTIALEGAPRWFMRPYHYDRHCARDLKNYRPEALERAMRDPERGVIRLEIPNQREPGLYPETAVPEIHYHPTAVWFDGTPDLAWYSPLVDQELGVTHVLRGRDLIPFAQLEATPARLMEYAPVREYHPLIVDTARVKFSKQQGAPRIVGAAHPQVTLGRLAYLLGLRPDESPCRAEELLEQEPDADRVWEWNCGE